MMRIKPAEPPPIQIILAMTGESSICILWLSFQDNRLRRFSETGACYGSEKESESRRGHIVCRGGGNGRLEGCKRVRRRRKSRNRHCPQWRGPNRLQLLLAGP